MVAEAALSSAPAGARTAPGVVGPLLAAAHIGPALAVTTIATLLSAPAHLSPGRALTLTLAVLAGQLTIGWGNDLLDQRRDRAVGRADKPLATGAVPVGFAITCLGVAAVCCLALSAALGWQAAAAHLGLLVLSGHAYNLGLKSTPWSWLPYAVAFGSLPAVVSLAGRPPALPPLWMPAVAAALGVAAHFLNVLPDLQADAATGVRGLPHRFGATGSRLAATGLLLAGTAVAVLAPDRSVPRGWGWVALLAATALAVVALAGRGRLPFQAAVAIALLDVALLVVTGTPAAGS